MGAPSTQSLVVAADPTAVMGVIADFTAYPEWAKSIKNVEIVDPGRDGRAAHVRFTVDAGLLKDTYELAYTWAADGLSVSWSLVTAQMQKGQQGSYVLRPVSGGTEVTYSLGVDLSVPMIGMLRRKAERVIMDTALKELKKRVESG